MCLPNLLRKRQAVFQRAAPFHVPSSSPGGSQFLFILSRTCGCLALGVLSVIPPSLLFHNSHSFFVPSPPLPLPSPSWLAQISVSDGLLVRVGFLHVPCLSARLGWGERVGRQRGSALKGGRGPGALGPSADCLAEGREGTGSWSLVGESTSAASRK